MSETVSIIVPVYNAAPYIAKAIAMVMGQTYPDFELLLVNDCSLDDSADIVRKALADNGFVRRTETGQDRQSVEEYADASGRRAALIGKEKNEGAAAARNTGLDAAKGRYIAFLDADDVWHEKKLAKELRFMKDKQAGFVFTAYEFGDEEANPTGKVVHVPEELTYRRALSRTVIFTTTVLLDRDKIPADLMRMPRVASEDTATWWQILRAGYTAYGLDETLAVYRRPAKSLSSNKFTAVRRIWNLYRRQEKLSVAASARYFVLWAYRATVRRL